MNNTAMHSMHPTKRIFDIVFSLSILVLFSPLFVLIFSAILIEHIVRLRPFDPLVYSETRMSQGKPFTIYKFNIFRQDVIDEMRARGEFIFTKQLEHNGYLISVGRVLRQIYMDELPQFYNVLRGDMSVVGPRPVNPIVHEKLRNEGFTDKDRVRAGLTGYHQQLHKAHGKITQEIADRVYIEYCLTNPWYKVLYFDMLILARTVKVLLLAKGV